MAKTVVVTTRTGIYIACSCDKEWYRPHIPHDRTSHAPNCTFHLPIRRLQSMERFVSSGAPQWQYTTMDADEATVLYG